MAVAVLLSALLGSVGCGSTDRRLVIFVLLDAARADRFGSIGSPDGLTPQMDLLAERSAVFRRHFAQDTTTRASLPKLLFSRYFAPPLFPHTSQIPLASPSELFMTQDAESISLSRALQRSGFHTAAISAHTWLRKGSAFEAEFDELHDLSTELGHQKGYPYPRADQVVDYTIGWLDARPASDVFLYLHLMDTHFPHFFEEDARELAADPGLERRAANDFWSGGHPKSEDSPLEGDDRAYLDALYNGSLRYVDRHLGRLFEHLRARGELDDTLIVITADHGESLLEVAGRFDHGGPWFDTVAWVPLIVHLPGAIEAGATEEVTEAVDVVPTILDLLEVDPGPEKRFDGHSLVPLANEKRPGDGHALSLWGIRSEEHKLLLVGQHQADALEALETREPLEIQGLGAQIYDVVRDPLETDNVWSELRGSVGSPLIDLWQQRLTRPYRRFLAARATDPPEGAFAIASRDFEFPDSASVREVGPYTQDVLDPDLDGWQRDRFWTDYGLYGAPGTPTAQISFPLPNGTYRLTVTLQGTCEVRVADGPLLTLSAPLEGPLPSGRLAGFSATGVPYGPVAVIDQRFRALVVPGDSEPCLLRYLGFDPDQQQPGDTQVDQSAYEERLKALGYVN